MKKFLITITCIKCRSNHIEQILSINTNSYGITSPGLIYRCMECKSEKRMV